MTEDRRGRSNPNDPNPNPNNPKTRMIQTNRTRTPIKLNQTRTQNCSRSGIRCEPFLGRCVHVSRIALLRKSAVSFRCFVVYSCFVFRASHVSCFVFRMFRMFRVSHISHASCFVVSRIVSHIPYPRSHRFLSGEQRAMRAARRGDYRYCSDR
jgi:hypothetical protein